MVAMPASRLNLPAMVKLALAALALHTWVYAPHSRKTAEQGGNRVSAQPIFARTSAASLAVNAGPQTFGALYFAYHKDPAKAAGYVEAVARSAASLKAHNPDVPVAVFTNARLSPEAVAAHAPFIDMFLPVKDDDIIDGRAAKQNRQWWTRTLYLNETPFDVTLQIDSDRTVCSSITELQALIHGYDMLHVSASILPAFDNGVMVYRNDERFRAMHANWLAAMERDHKVGDDQPALARALDLTSAENGFKSGVLPPTYQVKLIPAVGQKWGTATAMHSLVLTGDVKIVAGLGHGQCGMAARRAPRPRVMFRNETGGGVVLSRAECDAVLGGRCRTNEMDWDHTFGSGVVERAQYIEMVRALP